MPHLSPMFWFLSPLMYMFVLMLMLSSMWWIHYPQFPLSNPIPNMIFHSWSWA